MSTLPSLIQGNILSNKDLYRVFKVGNSGGMRKSNTTNALLLISNRIKSPYENHWFGNILHYTGMGQVGPQKLNWMSNKILANSKNNGICVHLFEVFKDREYTYQGKVELNDEPYTVQQLDKKNDLRSVWVFPLRLLNGDPIKMDVEKAHKTFLTRVNRKNRLITDDKLNQIERKPRSAHVQTTLIERVSHVRDPDVVLYALRRAKGVCELCEQDAPFKDRDGFPFLEVHHIDYLGLEGKDSINNVAALCPNCHRKMHILERTADLTKLKMKASCLISKSEDITHK